jgi:VacB/RNase II family 3'-5' exoribonuclease
MSQPRSATAHGPASDLRERAREVVEESGFVSDFSAQVTAEVAGLADGASRMPGESDVRDLRSLLWSSIDNRETRDLDQVEVCEDVGSGMVRLRLGVADVDYLVPKGSAIDARAAANTTSLYTGVETFPMLPEALSTDLTSLREAAERLVVVVDLVIGTDGTVQDVSAYRALVVNRAKLTYEDVGQWLAGGASAPAELTAIDGLADQVRLQDEVARRLRARRHESGALDLETIEARPVTSSSGEVVDLEVTRKNRARELIEDFMIAANVAIAGFLESRRIPSIRRVVTAPRRWPRLVELAKQHGDSLPDAPSSLSLAEFLRRRRAAEPDAFPDLSLSVVKLLGAGEYAVERPWEPDGEEGHFGLAVDDYSHTTAPNRRYTDLVMQRLVKATLAGAAAPYTADELDEIAKRCTLMESAARKVERTMRKVVAATLLERRVGEQFDAIVTGVNQNGTFARLTHPPAEGRIMRGERGLDVGDRVEVRLIEVDVAKGYIDFAKA